MFKCNNNIEINNFSARIRKFNKCLRIHGYCHAILLLVCAMIKLNYHTTDTLQSEIQVMYLFDFIRIRPNHKAYCYNYMKYRIVPVMTYGHKIVLYCNGKWACADLDFQVLKSRYIISVTMHTCTSVLGFKKYCLILCDHLMTLQVDWHVFGIYGVSNYWKILVSFV